MGRFYQTAEPKFTEDFIYKPPTELMMKVAGARQERFDNTIAQTELLDDPAFKVNYINDPVQRKLVEDRLNLHKQNVEDLVNKMQQDPENYQKYIADMNRIKSEVDADLSTGELHNANYDYAVREKMLKDNAKHALSNRALQIEDEKWRAGFASGNRTRYGYQKLIDKPDLDFKEIKLATEKLVKKNGAYFDETTKLSYPRIQDYITGLLKSHKDYEGYVAQQAGYFNEPGYFKKGRDANGNEVNMEVPIFDIQSYTLPNGNKVSVDEYQKNMMEASRIANDPSFKTMTEREKQKALSSYSNYINAKENIDINPESAWQGQALVGRAQVTTSKDMSVNEMVKQSIELAHKEKMQKARFKHDDELKGVVTDPNTRVRIVDELLTNQMNNSSFRDNLKSYVGNIKLSPTDEKILSAQDYHREFVQEYDKAGKPTVAKWVYDKELSYTATPEQVRDAYIRAVKNSSSSNINKNNVIDEINKQYIKLQDYNNEASFQELEKFNFSQEKINQINKIVNKDRLDHGGVFFNKFTLTSVDKVKGTDNRLTGNITELSKAKMANQFRPVFIDGKNDSIPYNENIFTGSNETTSHTYKTSGDETGEGTSYTVNLSKNQVVQKIIPNVQDRFNENSDANTWLIQVTNPDKTTSWYTMPMREYKVW